MTEAALAWESRRGSCSRWPAPCSRQHVRRTHARAPLHLRLAIAAVLADLSVSANLLTWLGLPYVSSGGCFLLKIHPGSYVAALACLARLSSNPRECAPWRLCWGQPAPAIFLICVTFCVAETTLMTGEGNVIVLLDTFMPAGWLAIAVSDASPMSRDILRGALQLLFASNILIAFGEALAHAHVVPLYLEGAPYVPREADFRPTALYDHPLTGAAMTMIGILMPPGSRQRPCLRAAYLALMAAGLIAFGGRMAILATATTCAIRYSPVLAGMLVKRRVSAIRSISLLVIAVSVLVAIGAATVSLDLGERLAGHLYWDPSAQVRLRQWTIIQFLDIQQWLFGCRREDVFGYVNALRLSNGVDVIENFWLLMFLSLGALGFPFFLAGLCLLLYWCAARGGASVAMVAGLLLVASSSNSLGRKSPLLVVLVAATASSAGRMRPMRPECRTEQRADSLHPRLGIEREAAEGAVPCEFLT